MKGTILPWWVYKGVFYLSCAVTGFYLGVFIHHGGMLYLGTAAIWGMNVWIWGDLADVF